MRSVFLIFLLFIAIPDHAVGQTPQTPFVVNGNTTLSVTATTASVALPTQDPVAVIYNAGSSIAYINFGASSVTATTSNFAVPPGYIFTFSTIPQSGVRYTFIAAIAAAASTTTLNITTGSGFPIMARAPVSNPLIMGTPGFSDTGVAFQWTGSTNSYYQAVVQNTNAGTTASADFIVANNSSTATTFYGDLGINSSNFTGTGSFNLPNATYLYAAGGDLALGTTTSNKIRFVVNSGATDAASIDTAGIFYTNASLQTGGGILATSSGEVGFTKIAASGSAPGAAGAKIAIVCGTNSGTAKIIAYAGTSATPVTVADNIGAGVTGC